MDNVILEVINEFDQSVLNNHNSSFIKKYKRLLIKYFILTLFIATVILLLSIINGYLIVFSVVLYIFSLVILGLFIRINCMYKKVNNTALEKKYKFKYTFYDEYFNVEFLDETKKNEILYYNEIDVISIYDEVVFVTKKLENNSSYGYTFLNNEDFNAILNILKPHAKKIIKEDYKGKMTTL